VNIVDLFQTIEQHSKNISKVNKSTILPLILSTLISKSNRLEHID